MVSENEADMTWKSTGLLLPFLVWPRSDPSEQRCSDAMATDYDKTNKARMLEPRHLQGFIAGALIVGIWGSGDSG